MKKVTRYQTLTGVEYKTQEEARREIEKAYGNIVTKLALELVKCDGKYVNFVEFIDSNFYRFVNLAELKEDLKLEAESEAESEGN